MLPPRGIVLSQCSYHIASMPVVFLCSPQRVLCRCAAMSLFLTLKILRTGIRFKISSLIGQYLEICVCSWELARTFCCHFMRFFHRLIGPKINLCQCSSFSLLHSDHFVDVGRELCFSPLHSDYFVDVGRELCWGSMGLCALILVVGVLLSWVHVFDVISVVLMSVLVWSCWVWGLLWFVFLSYCGVSSGVRGWSSVVVLCVRVIIIICFCHCAIVVFRFLVSPILVNHFCCFLRFFFYFLLERGPIGRGLLSRRLVRRRRWRLKGHLCSFSLFFTFSFSYRSLPCFAVQTGLVDTGSADRCGGARCYLG